MKMECKYLSFWRFFRFAVFTKNIKIPDMKINKINTETDTIGSFKNNKMKITINTRLSLIIDNVPVVEFAKSTLSYSKFVDSTLHISVFQILHHILLFLFHK